MNNSIFLTVRNFLYILLFISTSLWAQRKASIIPPSFSEIFFNKLKTKELNHNQINKTLAGNNAGEKLPELVGNTIALNLDLLKDGIKNTKAGVGNLYRLKIRAKNAQALGWYSSRFYIPKGGTLYIYRPDIKEVKKITSLNSSKNGYFAGEPLHGDEIVFEYIEPFTTTEKAIIELTEVSYLFKGFEHQYKTTKQTQQQECYNNISCSEGDLWQSEKKGVVRLVIKQGSQVFTCSGSLVNNTKQDRKPYILSARHCFEGITSSEYNEVLTQFNYEASNCNGTISEGDTTYVGITSRAIGGTNGGTDFELLELKDSIPMTVGAFWNGWDRMGTAANQGAVIHHPNGYVKKITTFDQQIAIGSVNGLMPSGHWRVTYNGSSTAGGSSGGPLFNNNGQIIGTLSGGFASCSQLNEEDFYGRFNMHWDQNGAQTNQQLEPWLDPDGTGEQVLQGLSYGGGGKGNQVKVPIMELDYTLVTTNNYLEVTVANLEQLNLKIFDLRGRLISNINYTNLMDSQTIQIPTRNFSQGTYIISLDNGATNKSTKFVISK